MGISSDEIEHLMHLGRLEILPSERGALAKDLEKIIAYVGELAAVKTGALSPAAEAHALVNQFREDDSRQDTFKEESLLKEMAPEREDDYFKVPRILE